MEGGAAMEGQGVALAAEMQPQAKRRRQSPGGIDYDDPPSPAGPSASGAAPATGPAAPLLAAEPTAAAGGAIDVAPGGIDYDDPPSPAGPSASGAAPATAPAAPLLAAEPTAAAAGGAIDVDVDSSSPAGPSETDTASAEAPPAPTAAAALSALDAAELPATAAAAAVRRDDDECIDVDADSSGEDSDEGSAFDFECVEMQRDDADGAPEGVRVLISESPSGPIELDPGLSQKLQPHQIDGIKFLWKNVVKNEGTGEHTQNPCSGAILAHSMGLGKTAQASIFVSLLLKYRIVETALILAPKSTLYNWCSELTKWGRFNVAVGDKAVVGELKARCLQQASDARKNNVLGLWRQEKGVLLLSYESWKVLVGAQGVGKKKKKSKVKRVDVEALQNPGPGVVVCDEGHVMRNNKSQIAMALGAVGTKKRVVLTGTPLQNNLKEYFCMLDFIHPGRFERGRFITQYERPLRDGQKMNATQAAVALMKVRACMLRNEVEQVVSRRDQSILKKSLPKKTEFVLLCPLGDLQRRSFRALERAYNSKYNGFHKNGKRNLLFYVSIASKIGGHPALARDYCIRQRKAYEKGDPDVSPAIFRWANDTLLSSDQHDWGSTQLSAKTVAVCAIARRAMERGEKVLLFSQFTRMLDLLQSMLRREFPRLRQFRIDGSKSTKERNEQMGSFQEYGEAAVFFLSTGAAGQGINLCTAHVTIVFDVSYNPAADQQAICRAYRYGLKHRHTIFRLVSDGMPEARVFSHCLSKEWMAKKLVDQAAPSRANITVTSLNNVFENFTGLLDEQDGELTACFEAERQFCMTEEPFIGCVERELVHHNYPQFRRVFRHESLLMEDDLEKPTPQDHLDAEHALQRDRGQNDGSFDSGGGGHPEIWALRDRRAWDGALRKARQDAAYDAALARTQGSQEAWRSRHHEREAAAVQEGLDRMRRARVSLDPEGGQTMESNEEDSVQRAIAASLLDQGSVDQVAEGGEGSEEEDAWKKAVQLSMEQEEEDKRRRKEEEDMALAVALSKTAAEPWSCTVCTLLNCGTSVCDACGNKQP
eukprot:Hpha_TRINITY_DN13801_c0_g1::TRINITY_DN13801_c0_g1_i1::g.69995::m.69995/K10876/RAD54L2; RAD54-like protein 2